MGLFKQILKEFWVPTILAVVWTVYNIFVAGETWGLKEVVNIFGPSFFLVSWATGQFFRVNKQTRVESNLKTIESRIGHLVEKLEKQTKEFLGATTGGESFVYIVPTKLTNTIFPDSLMIVHQGQHPIYDLSLRVVDVDEFNAELAKPKGQGNLLNIGINKAVGNIPPGTASFSGISMREKDHTQLTIQFNARNGHFSEVVHIKKVGAEYKTAIKVSKMGASSDPIFEKVDNGYPLNDDGEVDW